VTNARKLVRIRAGFAGAPMERRTSRAKPAPSSSSTHFVDYSTQKNWGLDHLPFRGEWIFILDADERITPGLREEVREKGNGSRRDQRLLHQSLTALHGARDPPRRTLYPSWNLRLFRRGKARYEDRAVHEHVVCSGKTDYMHNEMLHVRRESISHYLEKHIRYADMESDEVAQMEARPQPQRPDRRAFSKMRFACGSGCGETSGRGCRCAPSGGLSTCTFSASGSWDGRAGWHLAELMACYEYMITLLYRDKLDPGRTGKSVWTNMQVLLVPSLNDLTESA